MKPFGEFLKYYRRERGRSQRDVANSIGVDFTYLSKIESGNLPPPSLETLAKLANILEIPLITMLDHAGKCLYCNGTGRKENKL